MPEPTQHTDPLLHDQRRARRPQTGQPLRRSRDRVLGGVAGGVAEFIGVGKTPTRSIFAVTVPLSIGITAVGYAILWALLPGPKPSDR